jgi:hypothetical protein
VSLRLAVVQPMVASPVRVTFRVVKEGELEIPL